MFLLYYDIQRYLSLCGDVESNPGPNLLSLQTFEGYEKHKANASLHPCFVYTNIRSVNNKHEEISDFLQQQNKQTCFIVTETWINDNQKIPVKFESNNHHFVHQSISKLTQLTRGGGVGIWVPNTLNNKIRNDLNSINRSFFESLWLEIQAPFKEKLLVNVSYCSNKNLVELFF